MLGGLINSWVWVSELKPLPICDLGDIWDIGCMHQWPHSKMYAVDVPVCTVFDLWYQARKKNEFFISISKYSYKFGQLYILRTYTLLLLKILNYHSTVL